MTEFAFKRSEQEEEEPQTQPTSEFAFQRAQPGTPVEDVQIPVDEAERTKYRFPVTGSPIPDLIHQITAPATQVLGYVWDEGRGQIRQMWGGLNDFNMSFWQTADEVTEFLANEVNIAADTYGRLTDPTRAGQKPEPWAAPEIIRPPDIFKDLYLDAYINSMSVQTDTLMEKFSRLLGHSIPAVMEMAAFRKFSVERAAQFGVRSLPGQAGVGVGSMFAYGGFKGGIAGATDLAALDMLNGILGGFSWPVRVMGLSSYMAQQASLHGETGMDVAAQGILGGLYGMMGNAARGPAEREMLMLLKTPIRDWVGKLADAELLGNPKLSPALMKVIQRSGAKYLQDFHPSLYEAAMVGETGNFPEPFSSPKNQVTRFLHGELGEAWGLRKYLEGPGENPINEAALIRSFDKLLQQRDTNHMLIGPERAKIAHSLARATIESDAAFFGRRLAKVEKDLPLGQEPTETPEARKQRIEREQPVDIVRQGELVRTTLRGIKPAERVVRLPKALVGRDDVAEITVPSDRVGGVQRELADGEASVVRLEQLDKQRALTAREVAATVQTQAFDRQFKLKDRLESLGPMGHETVLYMEAYLNAPKAVQHKVARIGKSILGGLTKVEGRKLDVAIGSIAAAETLRRNRAAAKRFGYGNKQPADYDATYQTILESIQPERRAMFRSAIDTAFHEAGQAKLERMHARGLIQDHELAAMAKLQYSPRLYMSRLEEILGKDEGIPAPMNVPTSGIKDIGEGSAALPVHSHLTLMMGSIAHFETRIRKNDVLQSFGRVAEAVDTDLVRRAVPDSEGVIREQAGYGTVDYMDQGVKRTLVMPEESIKLLNLDSGVSQKMGQWQQVALGLAFMTPGVKTFATVANPEFAAAAIPRDLGYLWLADANKMGYSELMPLAGLQLGRDFTAALGDVLASKLPARVKSKLPGFLPKGEGVDSFIEDAGGFSLYGMYAHTASAGYGYRALFGQTRGSPKDWRTWAKGGVRAYYKTLHSLAAVTEIGEMSMRVAYASRLQRNGMPRELANMEAMKILNFARKGSTMEWIDLGIPYANATAQAFDNLVRSARKDPAAYQAKIVQLIGAEAGLYMTNLMTNPDGWEAVSNRERMNNFVVMLPKDFHYIDAHGNIRYGYIKVKKENFALYTPFSAALMGTLDKAYFEREIGPYLAESMKASLPYNPGRLPPSVDALFASQGFDTFWFQDVWRGDPRLPEAEYDADTPKPYVNIGKSLNLSPERMKAAVDKLVPNNLAMGVFGLMLDSPEPIRADLYMEMWSKIPMLRRFVSFTTPLSQEGERLDAAYRRANTDRFYRVTEPGLAILVDIQTGRKTRREVEQMLTSGEGEYFSPEMTDLDRVKIAEMYKGYIGTKTLWEKLEKEDPDLYFHMPSPFWFGKLRSIGGEERAIEYFEEWRDLPRKQRRHFEALANAAGLHSNRAFQGEFDRLKKERGLSFLGEAE